MIVRKTIAVLALAALGATAVMAQDVIAKRKELMKGFGAATGPMGRMLQGAAPFDLATVQASLTTYQNNAKAAPALFPDGSESGDTRALPAVFTEKDKFNGIFAKLAADAAAAATAIKDEASFKTEMPKVLANCGACHTPYRKPQ